jgi:amino acid adenylation domain-containing protein
MTEAAPSQAGTEPYGEDGSYRIALSREQARLWFLAEQEPRATSYHMAYALELHGALDLPRVREAFDALARRHELLRAHVTVERGVPRWVVRPTPFHVLELIALDALSDEGGGASKGSALRTAEELAREFVAHPFDLVAAAPLWRLRLIRIAPGRHRLVMVMHHLIGDGWSHSVLVRDWCAAYAGRRDALAPLRVQFAEHVLAQQQALERDGARDKLQAWSGALEQHPPLRLPRDPTPHSDRGLPEGARLRFAAPEAIQGRLRALLARGPHLLSALLLAPFEALLARYAGQHAYALALAIANRGHAELDAVVGFFVNTLALPADLSGEPDFETLLGRIGASLLAAQGHADLPLDEVLARLRENGNPAWRESTPLRALFVLQNSPPARFDLPGLAVEVGRLPTATSKFPLTLFATPRDGQQLPVEFEFEYDPRWIAPASAVVLRDAYLELLDLCCCKPAASALRAPLRAHPSHLRGAIEPARHAQTVIHRIVARAAQRPDAVALRWKGGELGYAALAAAVEAYAGVLAAAGVGHGDQVALALPRRPQTIVALLALLAVGAVYVPLEPEWPQARLHALLARLAPRGLIDDGAIPDSTVPRLPLPKVERLPTTAPGAADRLLERLRRAGPRPADACYAIHTSGSSGVPKAVIVEHAGLANVCDWIVETLALAPGDNGLLKTPLTFDAAARELYPPLLAGATLVLADADSHRDMALLGEQLARHRIAVLHCVPSQLAALLERTLALPALRSVMCGGERLPAALAARWLARPGAAGRLWNVYGPTEATVDVSAQRVLPDDVADVAASVAIGEPLPNLELRVVDGDGQPVFHGAVGELEIAGVGVARGYLGASDDPRFGSDPCAPGAPRRYRTGDLARLLPNGRIAFLGRADGQGKRLGVRIEAAGLEALLLRQQGIGAAHVRWLAAEATGEAEEGASRLVAFVAPARAEAESAAVTVDRRARWREVFETSYKGLGADVDPLANAHGWLARATRRDLPAHEIAAVAEVAAARIARWRPRRVLEIGCGAGLIALRVAPRCADYLAIDWSEGALAWLDRHARAQGLTHLRLRQADAAALDLDPGAGFDAIVVHSVAQYFDDAATLASLLERWAGWLAHGGTIYLGDVRDERLREAAAFDDAWQRLGPSGTVGALRREAEWLLARDDELCLAPGWFAAWCEAHPKFGPPLFEARLGGGDNELLRYRYDVTLARRADAAAASVDIERDGPRSRPAVLRLLDAVRRVRGLPADESLTRLEAELDAAHPAAPSEPPGTIPDSADRRWLCRLDERLGWTEWVALPAGVDAATSAQALAWRDPGPASHSRPGHISGFLDTLAMLPERLRKLLPSAELPDRIVALPSLPLTEHGKLDTLRLIEAACAGRTAAAMETEADAKGSHTELEAAIRAVFAEVVGVPFGPRDDFFLRGGHSLLATRARSRLAHRLGFDLPLRAMFDAPSPRLLARLIVEQGARWRGLGSGEVIPTRLPQEAPRPSQAQRRLWFIEKLGTARGAYHLCHAMRLDGALDLDALDLALGDLVRRHTPLRSRFSADLDEPTVVIDPPRERGWLEPVEALRPIAPRRALRLLRTLAARPFDLSRDALMRCTIARLPDEGGVARHLVGLVAHHIVSDGWAMAVALNELATHYAARRGGRSMPTLPLSPDYYDVAAWQARRLASGALASQLRYWWQTLDGAPARLHLPFDREAPARRSWRGRKIVFRIDTGLRRAAHALAAREGASDFMLLLAVYEVLLARLASTEDFVVGTVIANRHRAELEPLVGLLVNPLALRATVSSSETFSSLIAKVRARLLEAYSNQEAPFEAVLEGLHVDRRADYQAGFQVLFAMQNAGPGELTFEGLRCERVRAWRGAALFDLSLEIGEREGGWHGELEFSTDIFHASSAQRFVRRYLHLLQTLVADPAKLLGAVALEPEEEFTKVLTWAAGPRPQTPLYLWVERVVTHARQQPHAVAIEDGALRWTYAELAARARAHADALHAQGLRRGNSLGVCVARGAEATALVLAAHSMGVAVAFLDPDLPAARLRALARGAALDAALWLEPAGAPSRPPELERLRWLSAAPPGAATDSWRDWPGTARGADPAYIGFTSGSSGAPKAVLVGQRALALRLRANDLAVSPLGPGDRVAHAYTLNYDGGLLSLFWPLAGGATLVFLPLELLGDAVALGTALDANDITVFDAIPAVLDDLTRDGAPGAGCSLRLLLTGGDRCPADLPARVLARWDVLFANQYGPCEATINATTWTARRGALPAQPNIGRPLPDTEIHIIDAQGRARGIGLPGEIAIGGPALARGYIGARALTSARFAALDPAGTGQARRLYRSGDLGRWTADGELEFLGRVDRQVKLRGMRSDPHEIETVLAEHALVDGCRVEAEGDETTRHFVAYVVPSAALDDQATQGDALPARLHDWRALFNDLYAPQQRRPLRAGAPGDDGGDDGAGWDDTARGEPIAPGALLAWRDATVARLLEAGPPGAVLDIGCGLGLIALALAPHCTDYLAIDNSETALLRLEEIAARRGLSQLRTRLLDARALDRLGLERYDLIVLNSVVQYFPSAAYLRAVLADCAERLKPGGRIFIGDVRDERLRSAWHRHVARERYGAASSAAIRFAAQAERLDEELALAPEFFAGLAPTTVGRLEAMAMLKLNAGNSEMARWRYDVWLRPLAAGQPTDAAPMRGIEWQGVAATRAALMHARKAQPDNAFWLLDLPNPRLPQDDDWSPDDGTTLRVRAIAAAQTALDPDELARWACDLGDHLIVRPAALPGRFDAGFLPGKLGPPFAAMRPDPICHRGGPSDAALHNRPLLGRLSPLLAQELDAHACARLAPHLRPTQYVAVDRLPVDSRGGIDGAALRRQRPEPAGAPLAGASADLPLAVLADLWRELLGANNLSAETDFFALGGHSLLATRLVAAIRREFRIHLPALRVFELRTLGALSAEVTRRRLGRDSAAPLCAWHEARESAPLSSAQVLQMTRMRSQAWHGARDLVIGLRLARPWPLARLRPAWDAVVARHPLLCRRYRPDGSEASTLSPPLAHTDDGRSAEAQALDLERDGPLVLAWSGERDAAHALRLRAHPAFIDGDSLGLLLADLLTADQRLLDGRQPSGEKLDYGALARAWPAPAEWLKAATGALPEVAPGAIWAVEERWPPDLLKAIEHRARALGITAAAMLLGGWAHVLGQGGSAAQALRVDVPVTTRPMLDGAGVLGPFALDLPLVWPADRLADFEEATLHAAGALPCLLDEAFALARGTGAAFDSASQPAEFAFSYQNGLDALGARPWPALAAWGRELHLEAIPLGAALKLSVRHDPEGLRLALRGAESRLPRARGIALLRALRAALTVARTVEATC